MAFEIIFLRTLLANTQQVFEGNTAGIESFNHVMGGRERAKIGVTLALRRLAMARVKGPNGHQLKILHPILSTVNALHSDELGLIQSS